MNTTTNLKFKRIASTDKSYMHINVYHNNNYIGYYMKNNSKYSARNENWNFVSECTYIPYFHTRTRKEIISTLYDIIEGNYVVINQHFSITKVLNKK